MKRMLGLILSLTLAGAFAVGSQAGTAASSPRSGDLHVTKECSDYHGLAGEHCTITSSNLPAIGAGSSVFYLRAAGADGLDSDLVLYAGPGNAVLGHVVLSFTTFSGVLTLADGTGALRDFRAKLVVTYDQSKDLWHWDGTYRFTPRGHDSSARPE